ncbi:MAG: multidrug effflux MFS transporter [Alphaproteobacteria bacterium]
MLNAPPEHRHTLILLLLLNAISIVAMQFIVPAMPDLVGAFATTPAMVQLTLTMFMLGYAVFQIAYGPLSDRFGRKGVLMWATAVFVVGSFLGAFAQSIEVLIVARVLQSVGAAAGFVLPPAVARDVYGHDGAPPAIGWISISAGLAALLAPYLGGLVHETAGWRWGMGLNGVLGIAILLACGFLLAESHPRALRQSVGIAGLARGYAALGRSRRFMGYLLATAFVNGAFYAFFAGGAFVAIEILGLSPSQFGLLTVPVVLFFLPSAYLSVRLAARYGATRIIALGTATTALGSIGLLVVALSGNLGVGALLVASALLGWGNGQVIPNATAAAINLFPKLAGTASASLGTAQMGMGAIASLLFGVMHDGTSTPMAALMAVMAAAAVLSCGFIVAARRRPAAA